MKRLAVILLVAMITGFAAPCSALAAAHAPDSKLVSAQAAILAEQRSGEILFAKQEQQRMYPASLTKLLTALVLAEQAELDVTVTVGDEVLTLPRDGSLIGLSPGDCISVRDLIWGMLLRSGNDAAHAAAVHLIKSQTANPAVTTADAIAAFSDQMNSTAGRLGAHSSHFVNPDGYHDPGHYSTALDLYLIARAVMQNEFLRQIVGNARHTVKYLHQGTRIERNWENTNKLLDPADGYYIPGSTGLKTGTTPEAGFCLAAAAEVDGLSLISVVLNSSAEGRWNDTRSLFEFGTNEYQYVLFCQAGDRQSVVNAGATMPGLFAPVAVLSQSQAGATVKRGEESRIVRQFVWQQRYVRGKGERAALRPGVAPGTFVGSLVCTLDDEVLAEVPLVAGERLSAYRPGTGLIVVVLLAAAAASWILLPRVLPRKQG